MKLKVIYSGLIIWLICLFVRIFYLNILNEYHESTNSRLFGFKLSLFFFSPFLIFIIIMQYFVFSKQYIQSKLLIFSFLCFGSLGLGYLILATYDDLKVKSEDLRESLFSFFAALIFYLFNFIFLKRNKRN